MDTREPAPVAQRIPVDDIRPDGRQPRTYFKQAALKALAASIKKAGQRTPIEVRRLSKGSGARFEIIDGERRWRACKLAGITTIRACVEDTELTHGQQHYLSLVSNFLREGHTHLEISNALHYQVQLREDNGESRGQVVVDLAENLGKSSSWVYTYLALQQLTPALQGKLHPDVPDKKRLRFTEAAVLASLGHKDQQAVYARMLKVAQPSRLKLARTLAEEISGAPRVGRPPQLRRTLDRFIARLAADVDQILDFPQKDFQKLLSEIPRAELTVLRKALGECNEQLVFLARSIDRASR